MIPRYALAPMAELFADEARYATWLEVELLAVEAQAKLGVVPQEAAAAIREPPPSTSRRSRHASRSPSTTSRRSSTSSRSVSERRTGPGSTTA